MAFTEGNLGVQRAIGIDSPHIKGEKKKSAILSSPLLTKNRKKRFNVSFGRV
jgi:hypothetical protein